MLNKWNILKQMQWQQHFEIPCGWMSPSSSEFFSFLCLSTTNSAILRFLLVKSHRDTCRVNKTFLMCLNEQIHRYPRKFLHSSHSMISIFCIFHASLEDMFWRRMYPSCWVNAGSVLRLTEHRYNKVRKNHDQ